MVDLDKLVDELSQLTILEAAELSKKLEEKWGVTAVAATAVAAAPVAAGEVVAEKDEYTVILTEAGANKITVIKEVRAITGLGLKETKEMIDEAPKVIKEGINKEEATEIKKKLESAGATIEVK